MEEEKQSSEDEGIPAIWDATWGTGVRPEHIGRPEKEYADVSFPTTAKTWRMCCRTSSSIALFPKFRLQSCYRKTMRTLVYWATVVVYKEIAKRFQPGMGGSYAIGKT